MPRKQLHPKKFLVIDCFSGTVLTKNIIEKLPMRCYKLEFVRLNYTEPEKTCCLQFPTVLNYEIRNELLTCSSSNTETVSFKTETL